jgi:hypothetical protein
VQGPKGDPGTAGATVVSQDGAGNGEVQVNCPSGRIAVGGGVSTSSANIIKSAPVTGQGNLPQGWIGKVGGNSQTAFTVYVVCAQG